MERRELDSMDEGVLTVIVERMQEQRYPRALELKEKVDCGGHVFSDSRLS